LGGIYSDTAKSLGAHGERIHNPDEIGPAMARAVEAANSGQPVLLEMITKEEENISNYGR
jgi:thiamine pyrophosphate-dependent acetolactate synthase large subunit-like protein